MTELLIPENAIQIRGQDGPQRQFLRCSADICFFGGSAGGGKSVALILDAVRNVEVPGYEAALFRRTVPELTQPGGLWTRSQNIYRFVPGARARENTHDWIFPTGATIRLSHMQHDSDRWNWYGSELAFIGFDELITFSEIQFWFLVSRNRTTCGVRPYVRGTTNPDPDAWVRSFIDWWIGEDGYAIPERSGVIRWFIRYNEQIHWFDSRVAAVKFAIAVAEPGQDPQQPMSFTFIASSLYDNPALLSKDPGYLSKLQSMPRVDRLRLLGEGKKGGNWNVRDAAGLVFSRGDFHVIDVMPARVRRVVRYWDKAGTEGGGKYTAGVKIAWVEEFRFPFVVMDVVRGQWGSHNRERIIKQTTELDGPDVEQYIEMEPGSGGKESAENTILNLAGYSVSADRVTGAKSVRSKPYSSQVQAGNVALLRGEWNENYIREHDNYDPAKADKGQIVVDQVDASAGAFNKLVLGGAMFEGAISQQQPSQDHPPQFATEDELKKLQTEQLAQQMRSLYRR